MSSQLILYTIGHGARPIQQFLSLLKEAGVEQLVDIRRWPMSKTPHFRREALESLLASEGILYHWLGEELGGYRKGGYEAHMKTDGFAMALQVLKKLAVERATAIMCLEISPRGCHRRHVSARLVEEGWRLVHILGPGHHRVEPGSKEDALE